jgi:hypothetical protein
MAQKIQRFTRKKLNRARLLREKEAKALLKAQRAEEKRATRGVDSVEAALRGCVDR